MKPQERQYTCYVVKTKETFEYSSSHNAGSVGNRLDAAYAYNKKNETSFTYRMFLNCKIKNGER